MNAPFSTSVAWLGVILMLGLTPGCKKGSDDEPQVVTEPTDPSDLSNSDDPADPSASTGTQCVDTPSTDLPEGHVWICVTLDDGPAPGVLVMQGGARKTSLTDDTGYVAVPVEGLGERAITVVASHPEARIKSVNVSSSYAGEVLHIVLKRFSRTDNTRYTFQDPGAPGDSPTTAQCGHCHLSQTEDWHESSHRSSVSSPWVRGRFRRCS